MLRCGQVGEPKLVVSALLWFLQNLTHGYGGCAIVGLCRTTTYMGCRRLLSYYCIGHDARVAKKQQKV